jgi:hypothetical protein
MCAANPFRVVTKLETTNPGFSLTLEPWAAISQRLRRNHAATIRRIALPAFGVIRGHHSAYCIASLRRIAWPTFGGIALTGGLCVGQQGGYFFFGDVFHVLQHAEDATQLSFFYLHCIKVLGQSGNRR